MTHLPTLAESLGHVSQLLLGSLRQAGGGLLVLRLRDDGTLLWRLPASAWDETAQAPALNALGSWSITERENPLGLRSEILVDLGERTVEFQSPEVLLALRSIAADYQDLGFRLELPAGVRDIQRARAGLDSRPPKS